MNENCCLFKCFTELYFFYWLVEVFFAILIAVSFVFSLSWTSPAGVLKMQQNVARIKRFSRLHIVIRPLNKFVIMLKRNSINVHSHTRPLVKSREPVGRIGDFGNFLNGFAKSQLNIDWVQLFWKTVKYYILSEVCMINTAPHSTVSPQMWCIKV